MKRTYRITNREGAYVTERATKRECVALLEKYAADPVHFPNWSEAPYYVLRVEITHVRTFRPKATPVSRPAPCPGCKAVYPAECRCEAGQDLLTKGPAK